MDNSNRQMGRHPDTLGVNKMGKNIKKSPIHQPNFSNANAGGARPQPQPQVYNINKNDFRSIVQQLTGSPLREPAPRPPNAPKPQNTRLQKIKPPPLTPINRPQLPIHPPPHMVAPAQAPTNVPYNNNFARPPPPPPQYGQPPFTPTDIWANTAESPISAYMRYLQTSIVDSGPRQGPMHGQPPSGLLPNPHVPPIPSPRYGLLPSPRMNANAPPFPSPRMNGPPSPLPSPGINAPPFLPSPTSQFLLPSPSGFLNLLSPHSSYPLLSPGMQQPPPLSPNFSFSPIGHQPGILGPGPHPHPPPSPGYGFPLSPSGFFPMTSPRWRA
ncbi:PREDICTED: protein HAIKU1 [Ipomoea nil]|uniref:protein HAIKU1 n=1 Tax=Ipomoea nil TaxID=35883 RepID=UPI000900BF93|nr:PREDICTED: protein HAIKU1 [Ipomoea nil]